jgi:hypothetical protein
VAGQMEKLGAHCRRLQRCPQRFAH